MFMLLSFPQMASKRSAVNKIVMLFFEVPLHLMFLSNDDAQTNY
jgi:hypothetical protein